MRARDIMSSPVHTVLETASIEEAAGLLTSRAVTALPVLDPAGQPVGMVSEGDLLRHRVPADPTAHIRRLPDPDPAQRPGIVVEVMSPYPIVTRPDADVAEVAETMLAHDVRSMPVVQGGRVVGIVSRRDILRAMVRGDDMLAAEIQHRLDEYGGHRRWTATVESGIAHVTGAFTDETEQGIVLVLARTVPGIAGVKLGQSRPGGTKVPAQGRADWEE
ncbi:CBS domain-containing protein [Paractinoplanes ferrugineus]|uniref:CBS domain-containing protein n=1 Tax=Paractinoplanes ferrugineus TaxID=113564 RepID=A0A919J3F0_9ACTN|nr:CBS domain-containing protein [Actinoplanes ferrugineus]GIE12944.1 CBS domain-containing protein [Actinoplanes ferrugineus]